MMMMMMKVIENGVVRQLVCGFVFAFHCNYGAILYRLQDIANYWSKILKFYIQPVFIAIERGP